MKDYDANKDNAEKELEAIHYEKRKIGDKIVAIVMYAHKKSLKFYIKMILNGLIYLNLKMTHI